MTWDKTELEFSHWDQSRRELELHTTRLLLSIHTVYTFNIQIRFKMTKIKDGSGFALFKHWASIKLLVHTILYPYVYPCSLWSALYDKNVWNYGCKWTIFSGFQWLAKSLLW